VNARPTVGVVVTTFNHERFLAAALASVASQRRPADAVVVVDDGSTDDPAAVVRSFPQAQLIRQANQGLAAARNTGLSALDTDYVICLDADDCLEPIAIDCGLACFARVPACGFVYGGHRYIDGAGEPLGERFEPPGDDPYSALLRRNFIAMHGTVMYRRDRLLEAGAFDATLRRCEDYDVYLRMARRHPIAGYADLVAAYRLHGANISRDHRAMLDAALLVHARHRPGAGADPALKAAWSEGRRAWRRYYAREMAMARFESRRAGGSLARTLSALAGVAAASPATALGEVIRGGRRRLRQLVPRSVRERAPRLFGELPAPGRVRFGDLGTTAPISRDFGFDRGTPIDRYYIERFLERHATEIGGRVLEVGGDDYTRRFGGARVSHVDVLHVRPGNPRATIVGDLTDPTVLPANTFDCIVLTQTLHLIYDVRAAVSRLHRALAPGGVVLVTAPGISQIDRGEWGSSWFWSFTTTSLQRLFAECFGPEAVLVEHHGNVFAATAFLQGLAVEEVDAAKLVPLDQAYPVIVAVRARKRRG
jgi:glycosyltransferase involved in cell wall biosynthesis